MADSGLGQARGISATVAVVAPPSHRLCVCHRQGYQAVRERRRETLAGRGTAASVASPASPKSASAPHRSNCSGGRGSGAALALTGLVRAVGLSGIEGTLSLRGMVWIQMPVSYRAQGMARPPQHSPALYSAAGSLAAGWVRAWTSCAVMATRA